MSGRRCPIRLIAALALSTLAMTGCGGDEEPAAVPTTPELAFTPTETATAADATTPEEGSTPPAGETPRPTGTDGSVYMVEEGDTLSTIAQRFDTTVEALVEANDLADPDTIFPGDELTIPAPTPESP